MQGSNLVNIHNRNYGFFDAGGGTIVRIEDNVEPYLTHLARTFPDEFNRALRHVGWWCRQELQNAIYQGGPEGHHWPELSEVQKYRKIDELKGRTRPPAVHPFGKLVKAIGYKHEQSLMRVRVGWLSSAAAQLGAQVQRGDTTKVTPRMRRFFWAAGIPLGKDYIRIPARELFKPFFVARERDIHTRIETRIFLYLKKAKAKYRFNWAKAA